MYYGSYITSTNTRTTLENKMCYKTSTWKAESKIGGKDGNDPG
jgi:hypothetical protein